MSISTAPPPRQSLHLGQHLCKRKGVDGQMLCDGCQAEVGGDQASSNRPPVKHATQTHQSNQSNQTQQRDQRAQRSQMNTPPEQSAPSGVSGISGVSGVSVWHTSQAGNTESVRRRIFRLCRRLKAEGRQADDLFLDEFFQQNHKALKGLPWDEFRLMVLEGMDRVTSPLGTGPLRDALGEADSRPALPGVVRYVLPGIKRTLALCAVLQQRAGTLPFFLASNPLAEELGVDPATVARWLRLLVRDGVLKLVKKGHTGWASEYRFQGATPRSPATFLAEDDNPGPYLERY